VSLLLDERPAAPARDADTPPAREVVVRVDAPRRRRLPSVASVLAVAVLAAIVLGGVLLWNSGLGLGDIFGTKQIDRSAPVLVERLRNRSEFRGATGTFAATVDVETKHGILPTFVAGGRTIYSGIGDVDATVSLRHLTAATTGPDGTLTLTLPHARLGAARLDAEHSHVMSRDRGIADRIGGTFVDSPTSDREVQRIALHRIERAAAKSRLRAKAEANTARMVRDLASAVGVEDVRVVFTDRPASTSAPGTRAG
jgi:hypothetical protein